MNTVLDYFNSYVSNKFKHCAYQELSEIFKKCTENHQHVMWNIIPEVSKLFPLPTVLQCRNQMGKTIYLHMHGLRKTVYLLFHNDSSMTLRNSDVLSLVRDIRGKTNIDVVDAKLVHKTPIHKACMGQRFFLKLYIGKYAPWNRLTTYLKQHKYFSCEIHDKITTPYNIWMTRQDALSMGKVSIKQLVEEGKSSCDKHAYYKDVLLHSHNDVPLTLDASNDLYDIISLQVIDKTFKETQFESEYTRQIISSVIFDKSVLKASMNDDVITWTWQRVKDWFLHYLFKKISSKPNKCNILYENDKHFDSAIFKLFHTLNLGTPTNDDILKIFKDLIVLQGILRRKLKSFWQETKVKSTDYLQKLHKKEEEHFHVVKHLNCLAFDIETDFEPHVQKQESVTCIVSILFNHIDDMHILDYQVFLRFPGEITNEEKQLKEHQIKQNKSKILKICFQDLEDKKNKTQFNFNANPNHNIHITTFIDELQMINAFADYIKRNHIHFITGFNSNKFDIPFLENRLMQLQKKKLGGNAVIKRPTYINQLKFTNVGDDKGYIRYKWDKRTSSLSDGKPPNQQKAEGNKKIHSNMASSSSTSSFLTTCRNIASINMNTIIIADMMLFVGDPIRGCKLDTVSSECFGVTKVHNEKVSYENLCKTWKGGNIDDLCLLIGYCMRDVVLLFMLAKFKGIMLFTAAMSMETGLQIRELFAREAVKTVCSLFIKYGYTNDIVLCDTNRYVTNSEKSNLTFNNDMDFYTLKACGGRSVENTGWFDSWQATYDFSSQYPSIMIGRNICLSSVLDKSFIDKYGLKENIDYIKVTVQNVCETHSNVCSKSRQKGNHRHNCVKHSESCKFQTETKRLFRDMYYTTSSYFKGYCNIISDILKQKRKVYKDLVLTEQDAVEKIKCKIREQAVKITANSVYGVVLKMDPCVGGTVTEFARKDIGDVAHIAHQEFGYHVVTGDTDSVFLTILNKNDTKNFSSMCAALEIDAISPVKDIVQSMYHRANKFAQRVNKGCDKSNKKPLYPHPSILCVEKIFPSIFIIAKKCYLGYKIMPNDFSLSLHIAGISGKRADATQIKTKSQMLIFKMMQHKDFYGLITFMSHLFHFVCQELHVNEMIENEKERLFQNNDSEGMQKYIQHLEHCRRLQGGGNIPLSLLTSYESVGDLEKMKTLTAKKAKLFCFEKQTPLYNAPMFIAMQRGSNVQVTNFMKTVIEVILSGPVNGKKTAQNGYDEREEKLWKRHLAKMPDKKKINTLSKLTRLSITSMPQNYVSRPQDRTTINSHIFEKLKYLLLQMDTWENQLQTYRKVILKKTPHLYPSVPELFKDKNKQNKEQALNRLLFFIQHASEAELHPPSYMFDDKYATTKVDQLIEVGEDRYILLIPNHSILLWYVYIDYLQKRKTPRRYMSIGKEQRSEHIQLTFHDSKPERHIEFTYSMNSLLSCNVKCIDNSGLQYFIDMHSYRKQTQSTPMLVDSYDGKATYLINHDSYVPCEENSFSFRISYLDFIKALNNMKITHINCPDILVIKGVLARSQVKFIVNNHPVAVLPIIKILRDDEISITKKWLWNNMPVYVNAAWFYQSGNEAITKCPPFVDIKCSLKNNYVKIMAGYIERTIHATDGLLQPEQFQEQNAFELIKNSSSSCQKRKISNNIDPFSAKKIKRQ